MGFYHVGQAGLELLTSSDPPALACQSAGMRRKMPCQALFLKFLRMIVNILGRTSLNFENIAVRSSGSQTLTSKLNENCFYVFSQILLKG